MSKNLNNNYILSTISNKLSKLKINITNNRKHTYKIFGKSLFIFQLTGYFLPVLLMMLNPTLLNVIQFILISFSILFIPSLINKYLEKKFLSNKDVVFKNIYNSIFKKNECFLEGFQKEKIEKEINLFIKNLNDKETKIIKLEKENYKFFFPSLDYKEVKDIINKIDEKEIFKNRNFLINLINQANIQNAQKSHFMNKIINIENTVTIDINKNKNIFIKNI
jgi:hypothetical protein